MIEPVTALKAVGELARIAKDVYDYIGQVQAAPEHTRELSKELIYVWALLHPLRDSFESKSTIPAELEAAIAEFEETLKRMKARVDESKAKGFERLKWPFRKDENARLLASIERYKGIFELALDLKVA